MAKYVKKRLFKGLICMHILHHAEKGPVYGSWLIEELADHGYKLSPGTLYPILHSLEKQGLISNFKENIDGKVRINYVLTEEGKKDFLAAKEYLDELISEIGLK